MNYRHIYHAGNICDVVKHTVLTLLLERLCAKETGFAVLDTHAGCGLYDLNDPRAQKTGESGEGIARFLKAAPTPELAGFTRVFQDVNKTPGTFFYPGSPTLIQRMLRAQDRLIACELNPGDARDLKRLFFNDTRVHVHHRDGYEALGALLPPQEKRGLVLIDPPFEAVDEFERLTQAIASCARLWPQSCAMIWYPIKERPGIWRFHEALRATGLPKLLYAEFIFNDESRADRLNGSGLVLMNPPWRMNEQLERIFPVLHAALNTKHQESIVAWLNCV